MVPLKRDMLGCIIFGSLYMKCIICTCICIIGLYLEFYLLGVGWLGGQYVYMKIGSLWIGSLFLSSVFMIYLVFSGARGMQPCKLP